MALHLVQRTSILISAVILTTLLPGLALAKSASNQPTQPSSNRAIAAAQSATTFLEDLKLSDSQKAKIRSIRAARIQQIHKDLDTKQWDKLQQELKAGKKLNDALKTLNLNKNQTQQINAVLAKSAEEIRGTLTAQQRQKLDAYLKQRHMTAQNSIE
jgi:Spy/CpxP family protein refolding chaperone